MKVKNEQNAGLFSMVLVIVSAILLGNLLGDKGVIQDGERTIKTGQDFQSHLILQLILNYENVIQTNQVKSIYSRNNLPKIKDEMLYCYIVE